MKCIACRDGEGVDIYILDTGILYHINTKSSEIEPSILGKTQWTNSLVRQGAAGNDKRDACTKSPAMH